MLELIRTAAAISLVTLPVAAALSGPAGAEEPTFDQGRVVEPGAAVLTPRERAEPENRMVVDRLENLLPRLVNNSGLDMWPVLNRELVGRQTEWHVVR